MKYFYLLVLLTGVSQAAQQQQQQQQPLQQPAPVYRSAPTILNAVPRSETSSQAHGPTAEERESQVYVNPPSQESNKVVKPPVPAGGGGVAGVAGGVGGGGQQQQHLVKPGVDQLYQVYYFPHPGTNQYIPQPHTGEVYSSYQGQVQPQQYAGGSSEVGGGSSDIFGSFGWKDAAVAAAVVGLIGVGTAMWYPKLVGLKGRAMRELAELNSEDKAVMASKVWGAIRKFSDLNNSQE